MATITSIEVQKRRPDRVNIDLDGEYAFSLATILAAGLTVGSDLDAEGIAALQGRDVDEHAFQSCLRLISLRPRSEMELRTYLRSHKTPEDVVERTLARLRDRRHVDDVAFARTWVENRTAFRARGRRALNWELQRKGVPSEAADTALAEIDESALAYQAGLKKAGQLSTCDWPEFRMKVSAYLARRGFPSGIIGATVSQLWSETHPGQASAIQEETL